MAAIIGTLSIATSTGVELTASSDLGLAWKWAPVEVNATYGGGEWDRLSYGDQCVHVADALAELRRAHAEAS